MKTKTAEQGSGEANVDYISILTRVLTRITMSRGKTKQNKKTVAGEEGNMAAE